MNYKSLFKGLFNGVFIFILTGCSVVTPVNGLALPPVSIIEGTVIQLDKNGFELRDESGTIYVVAEMPAAKKLQLTVKEKVRVYGNLRPGATRKFDGYVIRRENGEQIIVTNPQPHFGFIIQTSFKEE